MSTHIDLKRLLPAWDQFRRVSDIAPIRNQRQYNRMNTLLHALLEASGGDEKHPAMGLVDIVGELVAAWENEHHPLPPSSGVDALRFLMEQHGLRQADLPELGSQGVVSEILAGKRDLNIRQVRALAERFGLSPATFL